MKIPYGMSNFGALRRGGYFYADKTPFLSVLERDVPGYPLFLRPRRSGKSLFVSLLAHYHDIGRANEFDELFRGLWIHEHPTPERNAYLVLALDFSQVAADGGVDTLRRTFLAAVKSRALDFVLTYAPRVPSLRYVEERLDGYQDAEALLGELMSVVRASGHRMFVLIDEYDSFVNRLLADGAHDVYEAIVERTGFVRTFYATLKAGTASGAVGRMFVTGVSPLLLDDLGSGFNISNHTSQDPALHALAGFTRAEVEQALDAFFADRPDLARLPAFADRGRLLEVLEQHYDGYRFSPQVSERIYNADMVLYFLNEVDQRREYPMDMLDLNVRTDYRRVQRIGVLSGAGADERRTLLESILTDGGIQSPLLRQFGARSLSSQTQFISLLYYLGMLTLGPQPDGLSPAVFGYRLEIPNLVVRELQWEHLATLLRDEAEMTIDTRELETALQAMAVRGIIEPFLELFHARVVKAMGVKDLRRFDEKAMKLMLLAFISLSRLFHPLSEKEFAQGYCDLFLGVSPLHPAARFAWLLELKYLPTGAKSAAIETAFKQAEEQVARYAGDDRLVPLLTQGQALKAGMLVFVGAQRVVFRPWGGAAAGGGSEGEKKTRKRRARGA
jgi:hypothetical protein